MPSSRCPREQGVQLFNTMKAPALPPPLLVLLCGLLTPRARTFIHPKPPPAESPATLSLAAVFRGPAVLQRGEPVAVFGAGPPGAAVRVLLRGRHVATAKVGVDGSWRAVLPAQDAAWSVALAVDANGDADAGVDEASVAFGEVGVPPHRS